MSQAAFLELNESVGENFIKFTVSPEQLNTAAIESIAADTVKNITPLMAVHEVRVPPPAQHPHQTQMTSGLRMLLLFSLLAVVLGAVLIATTIWGLLAQQVRQIGIMKTIGASSTQIFSLYLILVSAIGMLALLIGFPLGILARTSWNIQANFIGKHTLFVWPLSIFMRWQGGIPVDRRIKGNFVTQTVAAIKKAGRAHIVIAPEGTRSLTSSFKTGFYHIAKGADMPILLVTFDWGNKIVDFGELFHPTDNQEADLAYIWNYFRNVQGYHPEKGIF